MKSIYFFLVLFFSGLHMLSQEDSFLKVLPSMLKATYQCAVDAGFGRYYFYEYGECVALKEKAAYLLKKNTLPILLSAGVSFGLMYVLAKNRMFTVSDLLTKLSKKKVSLQGIDGAPLFSCMRKFNLVDSFLSYSTLWNKTKYAEWEKDCCYQARTWMMAVLLWNLYHCYFSEGPFEKKKIDQPLVNFTCYDKLYRHQKNTSFLIGLFTQDYLKFQAHKAFSTGRNKIYIFTYPLMFSFISFLFLQGLKLFFYKNNFSCLSSLHPNGAPFFSYLLLRLVDFIFTQITE